jgi:uncharacterized coiled-coil DUF342 family protein
LSKKQQEKELNEKISLLRDQKSSVEAEAQAWAEKRDRLNDRFKTMREQIATLKRERDTANQKVKEHKLKRDEARTTIHQKTEDLKNLRTRIRETAEKKPASPRRSLQQQFDSLEWKIQTTSLSLDEEKQLVEQVKQAETQLNIYKKLEHTKQKILETQAQIKALRVEAQQHHDALTQTAKKSQELHEKMLQTIEETKKVKAEADSLHQTYVQTREKSRALQREINAQLEQAAGVRQEILQEEEQQKKQTEHIIRDHIERQAREKIKRKQKLTWQEFQLLAEKGINTEDQNQ